MNIGLFSDTYFPQVSGVSTSIKLLKQELERQGHNVILFTTTDPNANEEDATIVRLPSVPFIGFEDRRVAYGGFEKAYKIAKKHRLHIVHTHTEFSLGLTGLYVANRLKIPVIHTYHTLYEKYTHYILNGDLIQTKQVASLSKLFCNQANGVIAPSVMTKETLQHYGVKRNIEVIPTGVAIPEQQPEINQQLKDTLKICEDEKIFLSLSRLSKEKSIDKVIESYKQIEQAFPNSRLLIVGDGPERAELEQQAKMVSSNIQFIGEVSHDDVKNYYQIADLYLNASESETQGLTYLEAFANRLAIVAKENDYLKNLMQTDAFGNLFTDEVSLAMSAIQFMKQRDAGEIPMIDTEHLQAISVETFENSVVSFYMQVLEKKANHRFSFSDVVLSRIKGLIRDIVLGPEAINDISCIETTKDKQDSF